MNAIVIGGNIASGKTTVAPVVAKAVGACFSPEPVEMWRASGKLDDFYSGKISAYQFQKYVLETRSSALQPRLLAWRASHGGNLPKHIVFDRWLSDDRMFAEVNHALNKITDEEMADYVERHASTERSFEGQFGSMRTVWLNTSPEECYARLHQRARDEESGITMEYLRALDAAKPKHIDLEVDTTGKSAEQIVCEIVNHVESHWKACPA